MATIQAPVGIYINNLYFRELKWNISTSLDFTGFEANQAFPEIANAAVPAESAEVYSVAGAPGFCLPSVHEQTLWAAAL